MEKGCIESRGGLRPEHSGPSWRNSTVGVGEMLAGFSRETVPDCKTTLGVGAVCGRQRALGRVFKGEAAFEVLDLEVALACDLGNRD